MKTIGIDIKGSEVIVVVLDNSGDELLITNESAKYKLADHRNVQQIQQFKNQLHAAFDSIGAYRVGFCARQDKAVRGQESASPVGFKIEGLIQLYEEIQVEGIWPASYKSHLKKNPLKVAAKFKYQEKALELAWYLMA